MLQTVETLEAAWQRSSLGVGMWEDLPCQTAHVHGVCVGVGGQWGCMSGGTEVRGSREVPAA